MPYRCKRFLSLNDLREYPEDRKNLIASCFPDRSSMDYRMSSRYLIQMLKEKSILDPEKVLRLYSQDKSHNTSYPFNINKTALNCEVCDETFTTHSLLLLHIGIHFPVFICEACEKIFEKKKSLMTHIRIHREKKPPVYSFNPCIYEILRNREKLISWIIEKGLVSIPLCPTCDYEMQLRIRTDRNHLEYFCVQEGSNPHNITQSLTKNSWFYNTELSVNHVLLITHMFTREEKDYDNIIRELSTDESVISPSTVADWMNYCQGICVEWTLKHQSRRKLGGVGVIVDVYESKIDKLKNRAGRRAVGTWLFAMIEAYSGGILLKRGRFRIEICDETCKDAETFISIIRKNFKVGTFIYFVKWRQYYKLTDTGYEHFTMGQVKRSGVGTGSNTQAIESYWSKLNPSMGLRNNRLKMHIHELLWRKYVLHNNLNHFEYFISCIKNLYVSKLLNIF